MANVKFRVRYKHGVVNKIDKAPAEALAKTAEALKTEVVQAQVVPFDDGTLQDSMSVDRSQVEKGVAKITMSTPYARKMYFHPEYNFRKTNNPDAKGQWFEDWLPGGSKEDFAPQAFAEFFKQCSGVKK